MAYNMSQVRKRIRNMSRKIAPRYVPPYDSKERHIPGMNYCGPGTNVWRRLREKVQPIDELDEAAKKHDLDVEPRGPYRSRGIPEKLRASDRRLLKVARQCAQPWHPYPHKATALAVVLAMEYVLRTGDRGRKIK